MEFRVLGPIDVSNDGEPVRLDGPRPRAILGTLLVHANSAVSVERLVTTATGGRRAGRLPGHARAAGVRARGATSAELTALATAIDRGDPTLDQPAAVPTPASRFVGRRRELEELAGQLGESRLLTVTGPGGAGKTREDSLEAVVDRLLNTAE